MPQIVSPYETLRLFQSDLPKVEDTIRKYEKISTSKQILWGKEMKMAYVLKMGMESGLPSILYST
jgi:hypothetical protein